MLERVGATVDEINGLTQRLFDIDRPGGSVQDFLASRNFDTPIPGYYAPALPYQALAMFTC